MPDIHVRIHKNLLWLILDKQPLNPLTLEMLAQLTNAVTKALTSFPRLVVITGMGEQAFCTGVPLSDNLEPPQAELLHAAQEADVAFNELRKKSIPTVALVKGSAYGAGCELAALCNTIIAREDARFRLPGENATIFPSAVSSCLPALIGQEQMMQLMKSGETLTARQALRSGLAHQVLPNERFLSDTEELLVMLAAIGPT